VSKRSNKQEKSKNIGNVTSNASIKYFESTPTFRENELPNQGSSRDNGQYEMFRQEFYAVIRKQDWTKPTIDKNQFAEMMIDLSFACDDQ
jgi:hypothetical protein